MNKVTYILLGIIIILTIALGMLSTRKHVDINEQIQYQNTIDSLDAKLNKYQRRQLYLDSIIINYRNNMTNLEHKIDSTENIIVTQRKDYEDLIRRAGRYSANELDTFFTNRYSK